MGTLFHCTFLNLEITNFDKVEAQIKAIFSLSVSYFLSIHLKNVYKIVFFSV